MVKILEEHDFGTKMLFKNRNAFAKTKIESWFAFAVNWTHGG